MTMVVRLIPGIVIVFALVVSSGEAMAQYYPPGPIYSQGPYDPRGSYRLPPADDWDDDDPGIYRAPPSNPYPRGPARYPYDSQPSGQQVERQPLPSPDMPGSVPSRRPYYGGPYGGSYDDGLSAQGVPGNRGDEPILRPPSGIGAERGPMIIEPQGP